MASLDAAREAVDLANAYGGNLDRSQEITLETCMGLTPSGLWAASVFGDCEPRQNGKGDSIQWRELYGATQLNERIAHTAHETPTALQAFQRMESLFQGNADLRKLLRAANPIRYSNGEWGIFFRSGAFIIYRTRTAGGLRGWDEIDLLVVDEAQHANEEHMAAIAPTQTVSANPQTYFAGSAGMSSSVVWWRIRLDAIKGNVGPIGYVEHTAEQVTWDPVRERVVSMKPDPYDEMAVVMANPAYGYRIGGGGEGSRRYCQGELRKLGEDKYLRERLGVWDPLPTTEGAEPKFDQDAWVKAVTAKAYNPEPERCTFGFDVHAGWSSVVIGIGSLADSYTELIQHQAGDGWLAPYLVERYLKYRPKKIGLDGTNGESVAVLGVIREAFEDAGLDPNVLEPLSSAAYKQACGDYDAAVRNRTVVRPIVPDDLLGKVGAKASARYVGDSWRWERKATSGSIAPIPAATVARALLPTEGGKNYPVFAF